VVNEQTHTEFPVAFNISGHVPEVGSKLTITLPTKTDGNLVLKVFYQTSPTASALQWLSKEQTNGKNHPFMFSQCQAIHARSILPCQDTPSVKFTYNATLHHPQEVTGLMSALRLGGEKGISTFNQPTPIPSYLLAIAVGDLYSRKIGPRSHVWAEKDVVDAAADEYRDTEKFLETAESICGPYLWKTYDLLVMPASFPFGGMENPCLTFMTPTTLGKFIRRRNLYLFNSY
jgi:leukotriene-A4 hydrolase